MSKRNAGFTLVELLVVMAIVSILAAMLLPALSRAREAADRVACLSVLKNLGMAFQIYIDDANGIIPPGRWTYNAAGEIGGQNGALEAEEGVSSRPTLHGILRAVYAYPREGLWCPVKRRYITLRTRANQGFSPEYNYMNNCVNAEGPHFLPQSRILRPSLLYMAGDCGKKRPVSPTDPSWYSAWSPYFIDWNADRYAHGDGLNVLFYDFHVRSLTNGNFKSTVSGKLPWYNSNAE